MKLFERVRLHARGRLFPLAFRPTARRSDLLRLGTAYGGWWIPQALFDASAVCYCAGAGSDVSFDFALVERFGCCVWAFDPTPASIDWVASQEADARFTFVPYGLAGTNGVRRFYAPRNPQHISHSMTGLQGTREYFDATCKTVASLMSEYGHDQITLIKLDVEGAEHEVVLRMLADGIRPRVVCLEFDQPEPLSTSRATVQSLIAAGYDLVKVEWFNMTFVHRENCQI